MPIPNLKTAAIQRAVARYVERGWQPIETAPKDGTEFLITFDGRVAIGFWGTVHPAFADEARKHGRRICGWSYWPTGSADEFHVAIDCAPTHWMPKPNPPEGSNETS